LRTNQNMKDAHTNHATILAKSLIFQFPLPLLIRIGKYYKYLCFFNSISVQDKFVFHFKKSLKTLFIEILVYGIKIFQNIYAAFKCLLLTQFMCWLKKESN